jgi:hypothetical protein
MQEKITIAIYRDDYDRLKAFGKAGEAVAEWEKRALDRAERKK